MKESRLYRKISTRGLCQADDVQAQPALVRYLWRIHLQSCMRREIANELTIAEYAELIFKNCYYCGSEPSNPTKLKRQKSILYNGIDRINNIRPYKKSNVVTCCKICNSMKSKMQPTAFKMHVLKIVNNI